MAYKLTLLKQQEGNKRTGLLRAVSCSLFPDASTDHLRVVSAMEGYKVPVWAREADPIPHLVRDFEHLSGGMDKQEKEFRETEQ